MTSTQGSVYIKISFQILELTSLPSTLTAKKPMKMKISADKIYYNFSQGNPKNPNIQNPHRSYRQYFSLKCKSGDIKINIQKYFSYSDNRTRSSGSLKLLSCRTSLFRDSFFVRIVHLWNALPDSIKCISSLILLFKKQLKSFYFTKLKNVFVTDNVRSYKIICPKCGKINAMSICNC